MGRNPGDPRPNRKTRTTTHLGGAPRLSQPRGSDHSEELHSLSEKAPRRAHVEGMLFQNCFACLITFYQIDGNPQTCLLFQQF